MTPTARDIRAGSVADLTRPREEAPARAMRVCSAAVRALPPWLVVAASVALVLGALAWVVWRLVARRRKG
jgi:hypothetical protein